MLRWERGKKMKKVRLFSILMEHFKGVKRDFFEPKGYDATAYGENETGKTRRLDAVCWVLFDKDSKGRSPSGKGKFNIKDTTIKDRGEPQGLDALGELILIVDDKKIKLKKVYKEDWGTVRGSVNKVLKGHTNHYWINDEPIPLKKDYDAFIEANIATEEQFKFITALGYFTDNKQHPHKERRNFLFKMAGDPSDEEIINSNPALKGFSALLDGKTVEGFKKTVKEQIKLTKEKRVEIPIQITEVDHNMPDIQGVDAGKEGSRIAEINAEIKKENALLIQVESGGAIAEKTIQMKTLNAEMFDIRTKYQGEVQIKIDRAEKEQRGLTGELENISKQGIAIEDDIINYLQKINSNKSAVQVLRDSYNIRDNTKFSYTHNENCSVCGALPKNQLNFSEEKALAAFNTKKAEALEEIRANGKNLNAEIEKSEKLLKEAETKKATLSTEKNKLQSQIKGVNESITALTAKKEDYINDPAHTLAAAKYANLELEIEGLKKGEQPNIDAINKKIESLEQEKEVCQGLINDVEKCKTGTARKAELNSQDDKLKVLEEKYNEHLNLCELFSTTKVDYTEDKINSLFKITKWKLFEKQVNGNIDDQMCEPMHNGVPYSVNLNDGNKVLVDLDISNTLSKYYGIDLFKFVDNAESVTSPLESDSQLIKLFAKLGVKKLKDEIEKPALAAVA